ncbi:hypothetical protein C8F04DRAFT_1192859 [Mycena alexandri]|uniref:Uncharacterized protein n=1 Tax=Mycena alexandri TaxID=1745969 RepID=A0AAD6SB57_9AGAR|nr:hypothetical protein C8F04DRAFT_1192859 [Mycena alexandri]
MPHSTQDHGPRSANTVDAAAFSLRPPPPNRKFNEVVVSPVVSPAQRLVGVVHPILSFGRWADTSVPESEPEERILCSADGVRDLWKHEVTWSRLQTLVRSSMYILRAKGFLRSPFLLRVGLSLYFIFGRSSAACQIARHIWTTPTTAFTDSGKAPMNCKARAHAQYTLYLRAGAHQDLDFGLTFRKQERCLIPSRSNNGSRFPFPSFARWLTLSRHVFGSLDKSADDSSSQEDSSSSDVSAILALKATRNTTSSKSAFAAAYVLMSASKVSQYFESPASDLDQTLDCFIDLLALLLSMSALVAHLPVLILSPQGYFVRVVMLPIWFRCPPVFVTQVSIWLLNVLVGL